MIRRLLFHSFRLLALLVKVVLGRDAYMGLLVKAHTAHGVRFTGRPRYVHSNAMLDPAGGLTIGAGVVVSTNVVVLTHDYAMTAALAAVGRRPRNDIALLSPVEIGDNCFLGAGVIVLPGTRVGKNAIVGAGAVVTGEVPENSVVAGNPARTICTIEEWLRRKQSLPENVRKHEDKY